MRRATFLRDACVGALAVRSVTLPAAAQSVNAIRVASTPNDTFAEPYYAADMGFFTKAGLSADLTTFSTGATVANAVASGTIDVGISNIVQLGSAAEHNVPFVIVAPAAQFSASYSPTELCVAKNSPIKAARDFEGQAIAVQGLKDLLAITVQAWLAQNGADLAKIRFVELTFSEMAPALDRGTIAGAAISEPGLTVAKMTGVRSIAKPYAAVAPTFYTSAWFTTKEWAAKNPDLVKRCVDAAYATARWANGHRDQSGAILAKYAKLDPDIVRRMNRAPYAESLKAALFQPPLDAAYKYHIFARKVTSAELLTIS
jgi:NitT/TauT family transport system substrate-binding protein